MLGVALCRGGEAEGGRVAKLVFRKSRRGRVNAVVRERYLRDDIGLGRLGGGNANVKDEAELASVLGDEYVGENGMRQILVLDTNVVVRQMDVLEREDCPAFHNVVLCDTVLNETKRLNLGAYNRALVMMKDDKRTCIAFPNENHRECWSPRKDSESANDYNDRLIRDTAKFYAQQVESAGIAQVLLITNDRRCRELARKEGVKAESIQDFVASISKKYPGLADLVALSAEDAESSGEINADRGGQRVARFEAHISETEAARQLKCGKILQGIYRASPYSRNEGSVMVFSKKDDENGRKVIVKGKAANRATEGDRVAVEIIGRDQVQELASDEAGKEDEPAENDNLLDQPASAPAQASLAGTEISAPKPASEDAPLYGKVVAIIKRNWRQYAGSVDEKDAASLVPLENVLVIPADPKMPKIRIRTRQLEDIKNQRILVAIDGWDRYSAFPTGHFVRALGPIGDRETETKVILHEHDIPTREFSTKVLQCLPPEGKEWKVTEENSRGRTDLRHLPVCSIDPPGCKDIDDALHVRTLPNGNIEVGVHIADVTHFVRPDTEIDKEASDRGTSTYLVEKRLDMLPGLLTTDICSLVGKVDRFTFSVLWEYTPPVDEDAQKSAKKRKKTTESKYEQDDDGRGLELVNVRFCKAIIHSRGALSYGDAQAWLDDPSATGQLPDSVRMLNRIARILRQRRVDKGALTLASQEVRFKIDQDTHDPTDVEMYQQKEANQLVEEFMLLANIAVARRTAEAFPSHAMLRRHPKPSKEMFKELLQAVRLAGVDLEVDTSLALANSLDKAVLPDRPFFNKLVRILTTRCMMQAVYFSSGEVAREEWGHYGLASGIYTHFTSPIRRYADVIAHRLLAAAEGIDPLPKSCESKDLMRHLTDNLNSRHHMAQLAGRASIALHTVVFFRDRPTVCDAMVSRVRERGLVVVLPEYGIEGKIALAAGEDEARDLLVYDADKMQITHKALPNRPIRIFDKVKVRAHVETRAGYRQNLVLTLVDPPLQEPGKQDNVTASKRAYDVPPSTRQPAKKKSKNK